MKSFERTVITKEHTSSLQPASCMHLKFNSCRLNQWWKAYLSFVFKAENSRCFWRRNLKVQPMSFCDETRRRLFWWGGKNRGSMYPVRILMDPVHRPGLRRGSTDQGSMFCTFPRSFEVIWIRISDRRSLGSWCIKGTDEYTLVTDSSVPSMHQIRVTLDQRSWSRSPQRNAAYRFFFLSGHKQSRENLNRRFWS